MLGQSVSLATISRSICQCCVPRGQTWKKFLAHHVEGVASVDYRILPTISFDRLAVSVILRLARRHLIQVSLGAERANPGFRTLQIGVTPEEVSNGKASDLQ